ncbi:MAG TPA: cell division protein FtsK, partial [Micromonospora sp.]
AQHPAGSVRFVVVSAAPAGAPVAAALAADLALRQKVEVVEPGALADAYGSDRPDYLVVFGMEALESPAKRKRKNAAGSRAAPDRPSAGDGTSPGPHVLAWWSDPDRFVESRGRTPAGEEFTGLVLLDVPGTALLPLDVHVDWRPRPERALLFDRHTGGTSVIVPFTLPGGPA